MSYRYVKHRHKGYVGLTIGKTRLKQLFENPGDVEEIRVKLSDGTIKIASPDNLVDLGEPDEDTVTAIRMGRDLPEIIEDINNERIRDEWLVDADMWRIICKARGHYLVNVNPMAWERLCRRRGYLLYRQNPRGF